MRLSKLPAAHLCRLILASAALCLLLCVTASAAHAAKPANTALPAISGSPVVTLTLSTTNGTWSGAPTSYTYAWRRCTNGTSTTTCTTISGATSATYRLMQADSGKFMRVNVTAKNASGSTTATSAATAVVAPGGTGAEPGLTGVCAGPSSGTGYAGKIIFSRFVDAIVEYQLYSRNLDGSPAKRLLASTASKRHPAWSPDGTQIVYDCRETASNDYELWKVNTDGTGVVQLTNDTVDETDPTWSPDGTKIAYVRGAGSGPIYSMNATGLGTPVALTTDPSDAQPSWGPTGRIAFTRCFYWGQCWQSVFIMNGDGTGQAQWVNDLSSPQGLAMTSDPSWSPDGSFIIYSRQGCQSGGCSSGYQWDLWQTVAAGKGAEYRLNSRSDRDEIQAIYPNSSSTILFGAGSGPALRLSTLGGTPIDEGYNDLWPAANPPAGSWPGLADFLGQVYQPVILFDQDEQWRILDVDHFFQERVPGDPAQTPLHKVCDTSTGSPSPCSYAASAADLQLQPGRNAYLDIGTVDGVYKSPDLACAPIGSIVKDCNGGSSASIYYQPTIRSAGYNYLDYWWFYRYNDLVLDHHEGDWEGLTLALSSNLTTFDWASFAQHAMRTSYLRSVLTCEGGSACGTEQIHAGHRVFAYVAGGSHATYPDICVNACLQANLLPEGDHGGEVPWGNNDTTWDSGVVKRFASGDPTNWVNWAGSWGVEGGVGSPANQPRFKCPWQNNPDDQTACTARAHRVAAGAAQADTAARRCDSWTGATVVAAYCSPQELNRALRHRALSRHGSVVLKLPRKPLRKTGSAPGLAQALGPYLAAGESVRFAGALRQFSQAVVRARRGRLIFTANLQVGKRTRHGLRITVVPSGYGLRFVARDDAGRPVAAAISVVTSGRR